MVRTVDDLVGAGLVSADDAPALRGVAERYTIALTPTVARLIEPADRDHDPISRQFVPSVAELEVTPGERADPIGDDAHAPLPGVVHRHPDRVLLKVTGLCPVYCRFCFRREMIGPEAGRELSPDQLAHAFDYIRSDTRIREAILTGGDPLILSPRRIESVTRALDAIASIDVIRWHTRVPVVAPERVTGELVSALTRTGKSVWLAVHANHPRELTDDAQRALAALRQAGIMLVSQTVLLKGVNDSVATLAELMWGFVRAGVKPYYLHHPDLVPGTGHFRLSIGDGQALVSALRASLSGLAQPTYVLDIPGGVAKVPIAAPGIEIVDQGPVILDPVGGRHAYPGRSGKGEPDG